jgi:hypothetical protein
MTRIAPAILYFGTFLVALCLATAPSSCSQGTKDTLKADAIGCGKQIGLSTYVQIPSVFAGDDWKAQAQKLGAEIGMEALHCAANDVLAILLASKKTSATGISTSQPEPVVLHLQAFASEP